MNNINKFTVADTQPIPSNGEVAIYSQTIKRPVEVILTFGIFFDGTGNNANNSLIRENYRQQLAQNQESVEKPNNVYDTSYCNGISNVYKLFQMYAFDNQLSDKSKDNVVKYQQRIYIEGVGTETDKGDDLLDMGTGFGNTGINAKIAKAITTIENKLSDFIKDNKKIKIQKLQFDVFGFSRGAATARYFANIVADQLTGPKRNGDNNPLTQIIKPLLAPHRSRNWQGGINGEVRFLGIFDTVAGLGKLTNLFDAGDGKTFNVDIEIRQQTAKSGLHLQAANEYRYNFSLNDVPAFFNNIILPGSHSDIGGGYEDKPIHEDLYITPVKSITTQYFYQVDSAKAQMKSILHEELRKIRHHPDLKYLFYTVNERNFDIWLENRNTDDQTIQSIYGVIRVKRIVQFGLDRIALRIMYNEAVKHGCVFLNFKSNYNIPDKLMPVAKKLLIAAEKNQTYQLDELEKRLVLGEYVHSSAEYSRSSFTIDGQLDVIELQSQQQRTISWPENKTKDELQTSLFQVHKPNLNGEGLWQRLIHPN